MTSRFVWRLALATAGASLLWIRPARAQRCFQECAMVNGREICRPCGSDWSDITGGGKGSPAAASAPGDPMQMMATQMLTTALSEALSTAIFGGPENSAERAEQARQKEIDQQKRRVEQCRKEVAERRRFDQDSKELLGEMKAEETPELGLKGAADGPGPGELDFKTLVNDNQQRREALAALQGDPALRGWCMLNLPLRPVEPIHEAYDCQHELAMEAFIERRQAWEKKCVRWAGGDRPAASRVVRVTAKEGVLELKPLDVPPTPASSPSAPESKTVPLLRAASGPSPEEWKEALAAQSRLDDLYRKIPQLSPAEIEETKRLEVVRDAVWRQVVRTPDLTLEELERLKVRLLTRASPTVELGATRYGALTSEAERLHGATVEERIAVLERYSKETARAAVTVDALRTPLARKATWLGRKAEALWMEKTGLYRTPAGAVRDITQKSIDLFVEEIDRVREPSVEALSP